jgi:2-keto-4-pentenoate hydratase/2-oxohepta-3-ene-1,7-dioic acid hydratase in catechol pathway
MHRGGQKMLFARISLGNRITYATIENNEVVEIEGDIFGQWKTTAVRWPLSAVRLLVPCCPSKVIVVGLNYGEHLKERGHTPLSEPRFYTKPLTALAGPEEPIILPYPDHRYEAEVELAIVMKERVRRAQRADALSYVFGYTVANDVGDKNIQAADKMPSRAKSFDSFCPLGPFIATEINGQDLRLESYVNGEKRQDGNTSEMIHDISRIIEVVSAVMTLFPGDVILTGTPAGPPPIKPGDKVECRIEGIGSLVNPVVSNW